MKDKPKKNPVLTSPWKIGMLVALLLLVVGFGTAYFMVTVYGIELAWLEGNLLKWEVDSYAFFKEMYPLAAGVLLLSILSYSAIASAVRRYRYFLNSGQDYRRLVQLADSIDDLTNPSQIARLKNYPELQKVLRNYGDQIREISSQLNEQQSQDGQRSVDLEMEIDTLLQGESSQDSLVEDRWWTPVYRKMEAYVRESRAAEGELKKRVHDGKTALGRVALSTGRIVEQISGAAEEYPEILRSVGELNGLAEIMGDGLGRENDESPEGSNDHVKAVVKEMENMLHKLQDGGKVLNEFSEENNGLALNIALMAAKGEAGEHDLAQFAEKVRSTADRFNRLSTTFTSMAQGLLGSCYSLKEKLDIGTGSDMGESGEIRRSISSITKVLEDRCAKMQERICYIGNEVHDVQDLVNQSVRSMSEESTDSDREAVVEAEETDMNLERSGEQVEDADDGELVIDHGRLWGEEEAEMPSEPNEPRAEGFPLDDETPADESEAEQSSQVGAPGCADESAEPEEPVETEVPEELAETGTIEESETAPEVDSEEKEYVIPPIPSMEGPSADGETRADSLEEPPIGMGEDLQDSAPHTWFKIDIGKEADMAGAVSEEIEVRETEDIASEEVEAKQTEREAPGERKECEGAEDEADEGEPIYDLYELGAVEYVEETMSRQ